MFWQNTRYRQCKYHYNNQFQLQHSLSSKLQAKKWFKNAWIATKTTHNIVYFRKSRFAVAVLCRFFPPLYQSLLIFPPFVQLKTLPRLFQTKVFLRPTNFFTLFCQPSKKKPVVKRWRERVWCSHQARCFSQSTRAYYHNYFIKCDELDRDSFYKTVTWNTIVICFLFFLRWRSKSFRKITFILSKR